MRYNNSAEDDRKLLLEVDDISCADGIGISATETTETLGGQ